MVGISVVVEADARVLRELVAGGAEFWQRWTGVAFGSGGVADVGRRGLRLVRGRHLEVGTRYSVALVDPAAEYVVDVVRAERDLVEYLVEGAEAAVTWRVHEPDVPGEVHVGVRGEVPELPLAGTEYTATWSVHPEALVSGGRAVVGEVRLKRVRARADVGVEVVGDVARLDVRVSGGVKGVLRPLMLAWPFLRRQAEDGLRREVAKALGEPDGERLWDGFVARLAP
ncbi:MAG: hypothetical protein HOY78_14180 [Saccharothrix sp.]|nr:hypothetical protein [Saccharothrix sp.]